MTKMKEAYRAIDEWDGIEPKGIAGHWWEIYGDPRADPADTETAVIHPLK